MNLSLLAALTLGGLPPLALARKGSFDASGGSSGGLIDFTDTSYTQFILEPREGHAFVLFIARDAKFGCETCPTFDKQFKLLAESYSNAAAASPRITFGVADYARCPSTFHSVRCGDQEQGRCFCFCGRGQSL